MATERQRQRFWVLHSRPWQNTSVILEVLSEQHGRVGAVVRGGRRLSQLQPFRQLSGVFGGRGELLSLTGAEVEPAVFSLAGRALFCGLYINELLMRLLHRHDPHPELFAPYQETLAHLAHADVAQDITLRHFEMTLLDMLGYGFSLDRDAHGDKLDEQGCYQLVANMGLMPAVKGFAGRDLLALSRQEWSDDVRRTARDLFRQALAPYLGDKPLASRELFR